MKLLAKIFFLSSLVITPLLFTPLPTSAAGGLVPCGTTEHPEACTLCHILVGGQGIITWGMGIMVIVGLALLMISGVMYIVSTGDNGRMSTARGMIEKVIGGLALILCGWLIVNTIIGVLANDTMGIGIQKTNWYTFRCDSKSSANTGGGNQNNSSGTKGSAITMTPPGGTTGNSSDVVVSIPSTTPVVTTVPSGGTRHVALHGSPDFSLGSISVDSVVQVAVVSGDGFFSSIGVPVVFASSVGLTITPTTITTPEEWRGGLTLSVAAGTSDRNVYAVTLKQRDTVLGAVRVGVVSPAAGNAMNNNNANEGAGINGAWQGGVVPQDPNMHAIAPSTPRDSNDPLLPGRVVDSFGNPIATTLYCGDTRQDYYAAFQANPNDGSVAIPRDTCNNNGGRVWVTCPDGMTSSPAETTVNQFNGSTFTCTTQSTRGGVSSEANAPVTTAVSGRVMDSDGKSVQATVYCGDKGREEGSLSYHTNSDGFVTVSKKDCDAKIPGGMAKVWVTCPHGVASVPTEMPVSQLSGSTFICVIPGTAGSINYMQSK